MVFKILSNLVLTGTAPGDVATQAFMSVSFHLGRENLIHKPAVSAILVRRACSGTHLVHDIETNIRRRRTFFLSLGSTFLQLSPRLTHNQH